MHRKAEGRPRMGRIRCSDNAAMCRSCRRARARKYGTAVGPVPGPREWPSATTVPMGERDRRGGESRDPQVIRSREFRDRRHLPLIATMAMGHASAINSPAGQCIRVGSVCGRLWTLPLRKPRGAWALPTAAVRRCVCASRGQGVTWAAAGTSSAGRSRTWADRPAPAASRGDRRVGRGPVRWAGSGHIAAPCRQ